MEPRRVTSPTISINIKSLRFLNKTAVSPTNCTSRLFSITGDTHLLRKKDEIEELLPEANHTPHKLENKFIYLFLKICV